MISAPTRLALGVCEEGRVGNIGWRIYLTLADIFDRSNIFDVGARNHHKVYGVPGRDELDGPPGSRHFTEKRKKERSALAMRTPRTPRDGGKRDRLPKIGEESAGPAGVGVEGDSASAAGAECAECDDDEWERLDLNGSGLEDTPRKAAPAESPAAGGEPSPGEESTRQDPDADALAAASSPAAAGAAGDHATAAAAGLAASAPAAAAAPAVAHGSEEGPAETATDDSDESKPSSMAETDGHGDQQEPGKRIKTLKDYVDGSARSPRGAELDQITVGLLV